MKRNFRSGLHILLAICLIMVFLPPGKMVKAASTDIMVPNGSFENQLANWVTDDTGSGAISINTDGWTPTGGGASKLNYYSANAYKADTHQTLTGLANGAYTLSAWIAGNGTNNERYLYAIGNGIDKVKTDIPVSGSWMKVSLPVTVTNNQLTIGVYADSSADAWLGVDLITLTSEQAPEAGVTPSLMNASFESDLASWVVASTPASGVISTGSGYSDSWKLGEGADGGAKYLQFYLNEADPYTADIHQTVTGLANGIYTISAWVTGNDKFNDKVLYADVPGKPTSKASMPTNSGWIKISLSVLVDNGELTIGFHANGKAGGWLGADLVTLTKETSAVPDPNGENIPNRDFEVGSPSNVIDQWSEAGDSEASFTEATGYLSANSLTHYRDSAYTVSTQQTITGLAEGYYTLTAWTQNGGGQKASYLFARDNGTSESRTSLPVADSWTKVTVRGIHVTTGQATIGLYSDANAGNWAKMDFVELVKDDKPYRLLKGGDVSELSHVEKMGGKFYDANGVEKDLFQILKENGHDIVRLRVYNDPGKGHGDGNYYRPAGIMDKADILKLAKRAKAAGLQIQLSFHYSDYWTNGATHMVPHEWAEQISGLAGDSAKVAKLKQLLSDYTTEVMQAMVAQGTTPEFVSLGNEMQAGILFPYGRATDGAWTNLAEFLKAGASAVKAVSPTSKIILHLDGAGDYGKYTSFFDKAAELGVPYDIIGPSYYPFWTDLTVQQIVAFCNTISAKYDKDIMIMETGYNWNSTLPNGEPGQLSDNGPYSDSTSTPEGQKNFMLELFNGLKNVNGGRVIGDLYWDPIMIATPGVGWAIKESDDLPDVNVVSNTTLFDFNGRALPAHDAYKYNTEGTNSGNVTGVVKGAGGTGIYHANVTMNASGTIYSAVTDRQGNYIFPDVPEGNGYSISASKAGYGGGSTTTAIVTAGANTTADSLVLMGGAISGTVTDTSGNLMPGATISVETSEKTYETLSQADGTYLLNDLPIANGYTVKATVVGYQEGSATAIDVPSYGGTTTGVNLTVALNSGTIAGAVIDHESVPVAGANVNVIASGKSYSAVTDASGGYSIYHVPPGTGYTVKASKSNYLDGTATGIQVTIGAKTTSPDIVLKLNVGSIKGTVKNTNGQSISGAVVTAVSGTSNFSTTTDSQGGYKLDQVLAGNSYTITAQADGYLAGTKVGVQVSALNTTEGANLRVSAKVPVLNGSFEMQGTNKFDIPNWVTTLGTEKSTYIQTHAAVKEGQYVLSSWMEGPFISDAHQTITGLANGYYTVSAWFTGGGGQNEYYMYAKDSGSAEARVNIPVTGSMTQKLLNVKVTNGQLTIGFYADAKAGNWMLVDQVELGYQGPAVGNIAGTVKDPSNHAVVGAAVKLTVGGVEYSAVTDQSGAFDLPNVPEGTGYRVTASKTGYSAGTTANVAVVAYETTSGVNVSLNGEVTTTPSNPSGSSGSSGSTQPSQPGISVNKGTITIVPVTNGTGKIAVNVPVEQLQSATQNTENNTVRIEVKPPAGTNEVQVSLPSASVMQAGQDGIKVIVMDTGLATLSIQPDLLKSKGATASGNLQLTVSKVDSAILRDGVRSRVGDNEVFDFNLLLDGKPIRDFNGNEVQVAIPYTLKPAENPNQVVVYFINDQGQLEIVKNGKYNPTTGKVEFKAKHFSKYMAAHVAVTFNDLGSHAWAKEAIGALAAREAIKGIGNGQFGPKGDVSRAEFIAMLIRAFDLEANNATTTLKDVPKGAWYFNQVAIAQQLGIVDGKPDGSLGAADRITREDMAVIAFKATKHLGIDLSSGSIEGSFKDRSQVSPYAVNAVNAMFHAGLIKGVADGRFAPLEHCSRAEAAMIIYRLYLSAK
ncbi:glycosyl hydrolase 53 family protein [Cohnella mopanensis]|uniref:glycosyl hydrolase 53 family protein n=1 Tax=Cohnella mopanensis TaxID=2911966 RepID=UPI001EF834D7|nr:glycosyl hydrolase 53 family protein [Cohnella mopanensis]